MPKLRVLSGREVRRILEANGFILARQRGSHMIMQKATNNGTLVVPVPDSRVVPPGTLLSIIRQSGLPRSLFETS
jgi:predicted RNA binding protein YcfA (HicA-like mRNA interferase family)